MEPEGSLLPLQEPAWSIRTNGLSNTVATSAHLTVSTSFCPYASTRLPLDGLMWNMKICREILNSITIGQTYRHFTRKISERFIAPDKVKLPQKRCLRAKWHQAARIAGEVKTSRGRATILLYKTYIGHLRPGNPRFFSTFRNMWSFHGEELLAFRPTPKMKIYPLSAVRDCVFDILVYSQLPSVSSNRNLRKHQALERGTRLSWNRKLRLRN